MSEEEKHRDPRQQAKLPETQRLSTPQDMQKKDEPEYVSAYSSKKAEATRLRWVNYQQALRILKSKDNKLRAMLYFSKSGICDECRKIEEEVFTDPEVLKKSEKWVYVRINIDVDTKIAQEYKMNSAPAFKALDMFGHDYRTYICSTDGPVDVEKFKWMLFDWL